MDRRFFRSVTRSLVTPRSRRHVLGTAAKGTLGGVGVAMLGRGLSGGLLDADLAPAARAQGGAISIVDFEYIPPTLEVPVGTEVSWSNDGSRTHTATAVDGSFDSDNLAPGQTFAHTFASPGTFDYFCTVHGQGMSGTISVVEDGSPTPTKVYVRPNVHGLDKNGPELTAFATAVKKMKELDDDDPKSWLYQAYIHAIPEDTLRAKRVEFELDTTEKLFAFLSERGWFTCEHNSLYFWPWHRAYLYWFERIVRDLSEYPDFALPYWDYSKPSERHLHEAFRDPDDPLFRSLYTARRDPALNKGMLPELTDQQKNEIFNNICSGFAFKDFESASRGLENTPHNGVHPWVGGFSEEGVPGLMSSVRTSPTDSVFWLHHANMDRLWSSWLNVPGNKQLLEDAWLDHDVNDQFQFPITYNFFDEAGNKVSDKRTARDLLDLSNLADTRATLGYEYEALFTPADAMCAPVVVPTPPPEAAGAGTPTPALEGPMELGSNIPPEDIAIGLRPITLPVTLDAPQEAASVAIRGDRVVLTIDGIRGAGVPGTVFEVYINLPPGEQPDFRSPYFVGNIGLFGRQPWDQITLDGEAMNEHMAMQEFNISPNIAALQARDEWTRDATVTIVPYARIAAPPEAVGATPEAGATPVEAPSRTLLLIEGVSISRE